MQKIFTRQQTTNIQLKQFNNWCLSLVFGLIILGNGLLNAQQIPTVAQLDSPKVTVQNLPKANPVPKPITRKKRIVEEAILDIAKSSHLSYFPRTFKVKEDILSRKYYNNNLFDIEESDNPFALPIGDHKSKQKTKTKDKQGSQIVFSELFTLNDNGDNKSIPKWLIFILLGLLSFMSIIIAIYRKEVSTIFQAFLSTSFSKNGQREQSGILKLERFSSYVLFVFSMGTFCFLIPQVLLNEFQFATFGALFLFILGLGAIYFLKHIQLKVLSYILPFPQEIEAYNFIISNTNKALGFILVPLLFLIAYTPSTAQIIALYFSFILLALIYIYRTLKGLATAGSIILFHKFHFFVYLCAVEIAPIVILLKLLSIL